MGWDAVEKLAARVTTNVGPQIGVAPKEHPLSNGGSSTRAGQSPCGRLWCLCKTLQHARPRFNRHELAYLAVPLTLLLFFAIAVFISSPEPVLQTNKCEQIAACILVHNGHGQPPIAMGCTPRVHLHFFLLCPLPT